MAERPSPLRHVPMTQRIEERYRARGIENLYELTNDASMVAAVGLARLSPDANALLVWDIDEVSFDATGKHNRVSNLALRMRKGGLVQMAKKAGVELSQEDIDLMFPPEPTLEMGITLGGTQHSYQKFPQYADMHRLIINHAGFNTDLPRMSGYDPRIFDQFDALRAVSITGLTTRPIGIAKLSEQELVKIGFPNIPVIARPHAVELASTTSWKVEQLRLLREQLDERGIHIPLVMIDDNAALGEALRKIDSPGIKSVVFMGPLTKKQEDSGLTYADNWNELPQAVASVLA